MVERKLLFAPGDPYDPRLLNETARYLRSQKYLYDASVKPIRYRGNRVDVTATTTPNPRGSRSRADTDVAEKVVDVHPGIPERLTPLAGHLAGAAIRSPGL